MGLRGTSFELRLNGQLAANAGLVTASFGHLDVTVTFGDREIPTTTVWSGSLSRAGELQATCFSLLRPSAGDWPIGQLTVVARRYPQEVVAETRVTVAPAVDGAPPTLEYITGRIDFPGYSFPGGGGLDTSAGFAYSINDPFGAFVLVDVEYTVTGHAHPCRSQHIGEASGPIALDATLAELKRIRITNVIGKTLELLPPFPQGTLPAPREGPTPPW